MDQRIKHFYRLIQRWRDEDLILFVCAAAARPALADVMATRPRTGKTTGDHDIHWDLVMFDQEDRTDQIYGC